MLVGFAVPRRWASSPVWVVRAPRRWCSSAWAGATRAGHDPDVARAAHPSFALFVLCLGVVVAALAAGFLGDLVAGPAAGRHVVRGRCCSLAVLATVLATLLTNLSATILLVPMVAPLGTTAVLAALLGLNIGSGLTWTGSLANLLWRRTLVRHGVR